MDTSAKRDVRVAEPATRRLRTLEEKLSILAEVARPGASVAAVARKHDVNANLVFAWRRLQQRGLLEAQRHAPPLLPVTLNAPTITPTRRTSDAAATPRAARGTVASPSAAVDSAIEILIGADTRVRLQGTAHDALLARILEWWPRR